MPRLTKFYVSLVITLIILATHPFAFASGPDLQLTGRVSYVPIEGGLYGIIGDDGRKYQPTNLPHELRKEGLPVKFHAVIRDNMVSYVMWGTIIEIKSIDKITTTISDDERAAIYVLLKRMDAFNSRNLSKLQEIDTMSKDLLPQQFDSWVGKYNNFILRYVEISSADSTSIEGSCTYTRELANTMTLHGDTDIAYMTFTLNLTKDGWKLTQSSSDSSKYPSYNLSDIKEKSKLKYGTDNLAELWH